MLDSDNMKTLWNSSKPLTAVGILMIVAFVFSLLGYVGGPARHHRCSRVAETGQVRHFNSHLLADSGLGLCVSARLAATKVHYRMDYRRCVRAGGSNHRPPSRARDNQPLQMSLRPSMQSLFAIMGFAIVVVWLTSVAVTAALVSARFSDRAMGWALRLGMLITVLGSATGGLMVRPTDAQLAQAHATHRMPISGTHTVGGLDGGPGMPGTGWSREHGDLRVPHFVGIHAMQILPMFAWLIGRNRPRLVIAAGFAYAAVFVALLSQALQGRPFLGGAL